MEKIKKQDIHLIFQQIRNGDTSKLNDLYSKYNKLIYGIAFSILKNKEDSEDIVQIVFAKIFEMDKEKLPTNNETSSLYSLTKNETPNYLRKHKEEKNVYKLIKSNRLNSLCPKKYSCKTLAVLKTEATSNKAFAESGL